jgi:hypothetical protein
MNKQSKNVFEPIETTSNCNPKKRAPDGEIDSEELSEFSYFCSANSTLIQASNCTLRLDLEPGQIERLFGISQINDFGCLNAVIKRNLN